jgi:large subunit ribosomal protein L23
MKSAYQIIQKPVITEKGLGIKETQNTLVFQVAPKATKTEIKEAVQSIFKVKVASVRTANYPGKERRRGKFTGYRPDWKRCRSTRRICSVVRRSLFERLVANGEKRTTNSE